MSVSVPEPHDSYAALKPAYLAWYGAPLRGAPSKPLQPLPPRLEPAPRAAQAT